MIIILLIFILSVFFQVDITELNPEADKISMTSDLGEDLESITSVQSSDAGHETEYVNPRGVRFMPHQQTRDGAYLVVLAICVS